MSNQAWMFIFGIFCIALSLLLFYGVTRREYHFRIDTVDMVQHLTRWNAIESLAGAFALALIVLCIGIVFIGVSFRR